MSVEEGLGGGGGGKHSGWKRRPKDMSSTSLVVLGDTAWEEYIITIADIYGCLFCSRHWPKPYSYSVI